MLGSPILDLALGMVFIYLLLSLIASVIQEIIATVTQARAANLERGLHSLFSGDALSHDADGNPATTFVQALYEHGLIRGLYKDDNKDQSNTGPAPRRPFRTFLRWITGMSSPRTVPLYDHFMLPAYIPARTFALALTDLLNDREKGGDVLQNIKAHLLDLSEKPTKAINLMATSGAQANSSAASTANEPVMFTNKAAQALLTLVEDALARVDVNEKVGPGARVAKFQSNLENWYNDSMDRASGWYKRYVQRILLVIGLAIAIFFNVDSIHVARTLWFDHDARQGLANAAESYMKDHPDPPARRQAASAPATDASDTGAASATATSAPGSPTARDAKFNARELQSRLQETVTTFDSVNQNNMLPLGWRHSFSEYRQNFRETGTGSSFLKLFLAFLGWCITAGALSLGAPFWFDMLNKIMVVRGTVKPSEKSPNEASKS